MRAVEAVKDVHSHTDRANEASRAYGDENKFEFPLRRASGATCESSYASARGGDELWRTSRRGGETRAQTGAGRNAKGAKKARAKGRTSLSDPPTCLSLISVACTSGMY